MFPKQIYLCEWLVKWLPFEPYYIMEVKTHSDRKRKIHAHMVKLFSTAIVLCTVVQTVAGLFYLRYYQCSRTKSLLQGLARWWVACSCETLGGRTATWHASPPQSRHGCKAAMQLQCAACISNAIHLESHLCKLRSLRVCHWTSEIELVDHAKPAARASLVIRVEYHFNKTQLAWI